MKTTKSKASRNSLNSKSNWKWNKSKPIKQEYKKLNNKIGWSKNKQKGNNTNRLKRSKNKESKEIG